MRSIVCTLFTFIIFLSSCREKENFAARGIVAFKMNNETWVSSFVRASCADGKFTLSAFNEYPAGNSQEEFSIIAGRPDSDLHYTFNTVNHFRFTRIVNSAREVSFDSNECLSDGELTITEIDTVARTVSGVFRGWIREKGSKDTVWIEKGNFIHVPVTGSSDVKPQVSSIYFVAGRY